MTRVRGRTEGKAVAALVLGLISVCACAGPLSGLPAMIFGALARRDIDRSDGHLTGRGLATGGIVTGLLGTGLGIVFSLLIVRSLVVPGGPETSASVVPSAVATPASAPSNDPPPAARPAPVVATSPPTAVRSYGSLQVVDLDHSRPLRAQLAEIMRRSHGRTVILQTYVSSNAACAAVAAALPDRRMQGALANVTLIRVDAHEYSTELRRMNVETRTAPWFYKLDAKGEPTDALSGDAWAAKAPDTMAPALGRFVHRGSPAATRHPKR